MPATMQSEFDPAQMARFENAVSELARVSGWEIGKILKRNMKRFLILAGKYTPVSMIADRRDVPGKEDRVFAWVYPRRGRKILNVPTLLPVTVPNAIKYGMRKRKKTGVWTLERYNPRGEAKVVGRGFARAVWTSARAKLGLGGRAAFAAAFSDANDWTKDKDRPTIEAANQTPYINNVDGTTIWTTGRSIMSAAMDKTIGEIHGDINRQREKMERSMPR